MREPRPLVAIRPAGGRRVSPALPERDQRFAAPACLPSPNRTNFRVASTIRPSGFNLLGCPQRRKRKGTPPGTGKQVDNSRCLRVSKRDNACVQGWKYGLVPEAWSVTSTTRVISGTAALI